MALFQFSIGNESFTNPNKQMSIKAYVFVDGKARLAEEVTGAVTLIQPCTLTKAGHDMTYAHAGNRQHGAWVKHIYGVNDTEYMMFVITKRSESAQLPKTRALYVELDNHAPYNVLEMQLTGHPKATLKSVVLEGRFRVLTDDEINNKVASTDSEKTKATAEYFTKNTVNLLTDAGGVQYTLTQKEAGKAVIEDSHKIVKSAKGTSVRVVTSRVRRINTNN